MMLARLRAYDPGRPLWRILFFRACWWACWIALTLIYRLRVLHQRRVPRSGPLLVVANHQSHLDPPAIGISLLYRHIVPIARLGLFSNRIFGFLIRMLNSIAVNEKEGDTVAIRRAIRELEMGRCILIFPEGSRTPDGDLQEFKRGTWIMLSRADCSVLPAAVEGLYEAWPRSRTLPRLWRQRIVVAFGEPIGTDRLRAMGPEAGLRFLADRVEELRGEAAASLAAYDPARRRRSK